MQFAIVDSPWWNRGVPWVPITRAARRIAGFLQKWNVDVVYTQTIVAPASALAAAMLGKSHVWHIHEFSYNPEVIELSLPALEASRIIDLTSNLIVFNSEAVAAEWDNYPFKAETRIVKNWVAQPARENTYRRLKETAPSRFSVGIAATVTPWKRQMDAALAVAMLVEAGHDVELKIIGPTPHRIYRDAILAFIKENQLEDRIQLLDYVEDLPPVLRTLDAVLVCSRLEPFGRVTIEAMSCGLPVIGSDSGGTPEILTHGIDGLLYPVGNTKALAEQLQELMFDPSLQQRLSKNAFTRALDFSSAEKEMEPLLESLKALQDKRNPSWPLGQVLSSRKREPVRNILRYAKKC